MLLSPSVLIEWQPDYSVNIPSIDKQHQYLVTVIRQLQEAMLEGRARDFIGHVFEEMNLYTKFHFQFEEDLLEKHQYPELPGHHGRHAELIDQLHGLAQQHAEGKLNAGAPVMHFLRSWLLDHICECDKGYAAFLKQKGVA